MQTHPSGLALLLVLLVSSPSLEISIQSRLLVQSVTEAEVLAAIDAKIVEKQQAVQQRYNLVSTLMTTGENNKQLTSKLVNASIAVQAAYRDYYNSRQKCDGLNAELKIIGLKGQIPTEECLQFPVAAEAASLFTQKSQLQGAAVTVQLLQKVYDSQVQFTSDASMQSGVYNDLVAYFGSKGNNQLQTKYGIPAFNLNNLVAQQSQKSALSKSILDQALQLKTQTQQAVGTSESLLSAAKAKCQADSASFKTILNEKLANVFSLSQQIKANEQVISSTLASLAAKLVQLQKLTADLGTLGDQYGLIVA